MVQNNLVTRLLTLGIAAVPVFLHAQGNLTVGSQSLHPMPKGFYGLMTEEINHSYDGGLYGELVRNRALKDDPNAPAHWTAVGGTIELRDASVPGTALTRALRVKGGGVANDGLWGVPIRPNTTYRATRCCR